MFKYSKSLYFNQCWTVAAIAIAIGLKSLATAVGFGLRSTTSGLILIP